VTALPVASAGGAAAAGGGGGGVSNAVNLNAFYLEMQLPGMPLS